MAVNDGDKYKLRVGKGSRTIFNVEVVISNAARIQGLSGRQSLHRGHGMLFIFDNIAKQSMWMFDMRIPLDIVWLNENMEVVHLSKNCTPCPSQHNCPVHTSKYKVKYAIEMTAGEATNFGFELGKQLFVV